MSLGPRSSSLLNRDSLAAAIFMTAALSPTLGVAEWRLNGVASTTFETVTDRERDGDEDPAFGATGVLSVTLAALSPRTQWATTVGVTGSKFAGPGAEDDFDRLDPNLATSISHNAGLWGFGANASFDAQPTSITQLEDSGLTDEDVIQYSTRVGASASYRLSARDSVSLGLSAALIEFSEQNNQLTPSFSLSANGGYQHAVNERLATNFNLGANRVFADDVPETTSTSVNGTVGVSYQLHNRLRFNFGLGPSATLTETVNPQTSDVTFGATGDAGLTWRADNQTSLGFEASQGLETSADGGLDNVARAGASVTHAVNQTFSSALALSYVRRTEDSAFISADSELDLVSVSPSVNLSLDRDVRATAGYSLTLSRENGRKAMSNRVFVTLTTDF